MLQHVHGSNQIGPWCNHSDSVFTVPPNQDPNHVTGIHWLPVPDGSKLDSSLFQNCPAVFNLTVPSNMIKLRASLAEGLI